MDIPVINAAKNRSSAAQANMYKQFFGLSDNPFNVNPDPRYLYLTSQTREALDELTYGIQARKGLILLTGEVGTGKTTLINRVLDWLHQQRTPTAFIFNPHLGTNHLFDFILSDFEVPFDSRSKDNALMRLNQWLIERYRTDDIPVLIVDEAQGLPIHVLEEIRLLLNLETPHEKLLQIVLVGQPELEERLKRPDLRQLKQRITLRCKTAALTLEETHDYIQARLHIAGANGKAIFASQAMDAVHFYSRGIPRVANLLCEHALINSYVDNVRPVPPHIIEEIAREFQLDGFKPLALAMDSKGAPGVAAVAPQPAPANALEPAPAEAEPLLQEAPSDTETCVSLSSVVADAFPGRSGEIAAPLLDCETTPALAEINVLDVSPPVLAAIEPGRIEEGKRPESTAGDSAAAVGIGYELAMEQAPITSSAFLHAFKAKEKYDLSPVSSRCQAADTQKAARRPTTANAATSTPAKPKRMSLDGLCLSLAHRGASWKMRILSAVHSPLWRQAIGALLSRQRRPHQLVGALRQRPPAGRSGSQPVAGSAPWSRTLAYLYGRLRQPVDPMQLWRLPYSWLFKPRPKLSFKSK